jgi:hypothetical protein
MTATAAAETDRKALANEVADRILKAFDEIETADGYLNDTDLLKASGVSRGALL